jgi:phage shock protein A
MANTEHNMDSETTRVITELQIMLKQTQDDMRELKLDMKELKKCLPTLEAHSNLTKRVEKIEANISKITWMVISAVVGAILLLVLGQ